MYVYQYVPLPVQILSVPVPEVVTTTNRTGPLYAGTGLTLTCTITLHPNVDNGESVMMRLSFPSSLSNNQYSDTGVRISGKTYTRNITMSPLLIRYSGRYVCAVTVTGRNVNQATNTGAIDISVISKLSYT